MGFIDRLERRVGGLSFPGLLRYYAWFYVLVYGLRIFRPGLEEALEFDRAKILSGEVWRLFTFLFSSPAFFGPGLFGVLFLFFMVMIASMMSDALEGAWGTFRTTLFLYLGITGLIAANWVFPNALRGSGMLLYQAAFFAFATLFPKVEFRLFLILPVQVRFLAILLAVMLLLSVFGQPLLIVYYLLAFANYLLFAAIPAWRGQLRVRESVQRRKRFEKGKASGDEAFHRCVVCQRSDVSDPGLEFRVGADGEEYCEEHLPS